MNKPVCGDCPDYKSIGGSGGVCEPTQGIRSTYVMYVSPDQVACPVRIRELKALAEVERLRGKLEEIASETGEVCPPGRVCPRDETTCQECWQEFINK